MLSPRIIIITQNRTRIVDPLVSKHNIIGIIDSEPKSSTEGGNNTNKLFRFLSKFYSIFKKNNSFEKYSISKGVDYLYLTKNNFRELNKWIEIRKPDLIIVCGMSFLLKKEIFDIPKLGTINLHPSYLPKYRGPNPWFWMYYNMEKKGGVTLHYINEGEDTGDIIYQEEYEIKKGMKSPEMQDIAIKDIGVDLINRAINNIDNLPRIKQNIDSPTERARRIRESEHKDIINWDEWGVEKIWHILGGTELWLNAIEQPDGKYKGQRWEILEYRKLDTSSYKISNVYKEKGKIFIVCNDGVIFLNVKFKIKSYIYNLYN